MSKRYEKAKTRDHRGKHIGGSGNPDYTRGEIQGEVKAWSRPLSKYDVKKEVGKGRNEIISKSGFTEGAINYAERYCPNLKLITKNKVVKNRK